MPRPAPRTVDHRGKPCGIAADLRDPPALLPMRRADVPLGQSTQRRLRLACGLVAAAIGLLVGIVTLTIIALQGLIRPWIHPLVVYGLPATGVLFVAARVATVRARSHWHATGRTEAALRLAARGQCPACGVWLLSTPRDADGLTTCPTCKAAWKVGHAGGCPNCGYDMSRVPATAGPLAICPECATLSAAAGGTHEQGDVQKR